MSLVYRALNTMNRSLPAATTALGLLAVPAFGVVPSMITLGELFDIFMLAALLQVNGGIAIGTVPGRKVPETEAPAVRAWTEHR